MTNNIIYNSDTELDKKSAFESFRDIYGTNVYVNI